MKSFFKLALCASILSVSLFSCIKDDSWNKDLEDTTYIGVGTVNKEGGKFFFKEDDGTTIYPRNYQNLSDTMINKKTWFKFCKYKDAYKEVGFNQTAYLLEFGRTVLTKSFFKIETKQQNDSIGNDPINLQAVWLTGQYLNVEFIYKGSGSKAHYINLAQNLFQPTSTGKDTIRLEFRHNNREDAAYMYYQGVASFDISKIYPDAGGKLAFIYKPFNEPERTFYVNLPSLLYTINSSKK